jgi:hypothetical protein
MAMTKDLLTLKDAQKTGRMVEFISQDEKQLPRALTNPL